MNPRRTQYLLLSLAVVLCALPARSCGPDFPEAVFVTLQHPDGNYAAFAGGRLGVPQSGYRTRDLVAIYNWLTQRPLSKSEQAEAVAVQHYYMDDWSEQQAAEKAAPPNGMDVWLKARAAFGAVDGKTPAAAIPNDRAVNSDGWDTVTNCLDDAFATAARTLDARMQAYGSKSPAVVEWVRGQDAVFTNCTDARTPRYYGPGQAPPPPPQPYAPAQLASDAPLWLRQDRAYQLAAAHFYATQYDTAIAGFRTIAGDSTSPWSTTARYVVARALIRKATMGNDQLSNPSGDAARQAAAKTQMEQTLTAAQGELVAMSKEPRMAPMRNTIEALLDYVNLRLQPEKQAAVLAERLHTAGTPRYKQSVIDLTYLRINPYGEPKSLSPAAAANDHSGLLLWIDIFSTGNETRALEQWRQTPNMPWLLAAISFAQPGDAGVAELMHAAEAVPKTDPAWTAMTYHRLRLMSRDAAMRQELLAVLPDIEKSENDSTVNLFTALTHATAPTLENWLASAGRVPAAETSWGNDDTVTVPKEDVCGSKMYPAAYKLFDIDAAYALNNRFPLRLLAESAESKMLPVDLRFQVAQAAWVRAVMLDQPAIARRMTPILVGCRAAWKPLLAAYDAATTADERKATGLLAMMRFASTEPSVRYGEERRNGFAAYDEYRQNWWCTTVPSSDTVDDMAKPPSPTPAAKVVLPDPLFLTVAERNEAETEVATLRKVPNAANYFATEAIAWQQAHPHDARSVSIVGEALRVEKSSCSEDTTPPLAHRLFDILHRDYPQSEWTRKNTTWR